MNVYENMYPYMKEEKDDQNMDAADQEKNHSRDIECEESKGNISCSSSRVEILCEPDAYINPDYNTEELSDVKEEKIEGGESNALNLVNTTEANINEDHAGLIKLEGVKQEAAEVQDDPLIDQLTGSNINSVNIDEVQNIKKES